MRELALGLCFALLATAATAGDRLQPICARSAVLGRLAEALRHAGRASFLDAATVGEVSTGPGLVRCAVQVHRLVWDTNRYGYLPLDQGEIVQYTLELRRNGILLRVR